jgi:nitric oxide dioxygenase
MEDGMNAQQIHLVQASFAQIAPLGGAVGTMFYAKLFQLDPLLRACCKGGAEGQQGLMTMLACAVDGLARPDELAPAVQAFAQRHANCDVPRWHAPTIGYALNWMLERALGNGYTPDVQEAWMQAYSLLADVMQAAVATP